MTVAGEMRSILDNPQRPLTDATLLEALGGIPTESGVSVTPGNAWRHLAVYRAIAIRAALIGSTPIQAFRQSTSGGRQRAVSPIIDNPHPDMTPMEWKEFVGTCLMTDGNFYAWKVRDGMGRIRELEPIHPSAVLPSRKPEWVSDANPLGKRFEITVEAKTATHTAYDILHIPGISYDGVRGLSPIAYARQAIGLGLAAETFAARMFGRGALIQGVLQTDKKLDEESARRTQSRWRSRTTGPDAQWNIPVLDNSLKFQPVQLPPVDAQFLETYAKSVTDVACLWGIPPHLLGDVERSTSWGTGIEQQTLQMLMVTVDPDFVRIEQRISREAVLDSSIYAKFNRGAFLRTDMATRYLAHQRAINNGWENADEIRDMEDQDPLPDGLGQIFYRPGNVVPAGQPAEVPA